MALKSPLVVGNGYPQVIQSGDTLSVPSLQSAGQITSTVASGAAPFIVASTTRVNNLNAELIDGVTSGVLVKNNTANTTIGTGVTGQDIWLSISNPGVGRTSGFQFLKANDGAGIAVTEVTGDSTLYEFYMSDNPDGGDTYSWRFTDWQSSNTLWQPLKLTSLYTQLVGTDHYVTGRIFQENTVRYSTQNASAANAGKNDCIFNTPSSLKVAGTGSISISNLNVNGYNGGGGKGAAFWLRLTGTGTTFEWAYGSTQFSTPVQTGLSVSTSPVTLSNGLTVTFSSTTGGVAGDIFSCRIWQPSTNNFYSSAITGTLSVSGQITSTVSNGTAPLVITSTTKVTNLNADLLDGNDGSYYLNYDNLTNKPVGGGGGVPADGTGATGTWPISITGSAGSVAWANITGFPGYSKDETNVIVNDMRTKIEEITNILAALRGASITTDWVTLSSGSTFYTSAEVDVIVTDINAKINDLYSLTTAL